MRVALHPRAASEAGKFLKIVADKESTKQALIGFHNKFDVLQDAVRKFAEKQKGMREQIKQNLEKTLEEMVRTKKTKKHGKDKKNEQLKKMKDGNQLLLLSEMLKRLYNARKMVAYRTKQLLKVSELKELARKDMPARFNHVLLQTLGLHVNEEANQSEIVQLIM